MSAVVVTPNYPTCVDHGGPHHLIIVNTSMVRIRVGYAGRRIVDRALNPFDKPATRPAPFNTGALRRFLSVARLQFNSFRLIRLPGSRFSSLHGARALFQSSARRVADVFHSLSLLLPTADQHGRKERQGAVKE